MAAEQTPAEKFLELKLREILSKPHSKKYGEWKGSLKTLVTNFRIIVDKFDNLLYKINSIFAVLDILKAKKEGDESYCENKTSELFKDKYKNVENYEDDKKKYVNFCADTYNVGINNTQLDEYKKNLAEYKLILEDYTKNYKKKVNNHFGVNNWINEQPFDSNPRGTTVDPFDQFYIGNRNEYRKIMKKVLNKQMKKAIKKFNKYQKLIDTLITGEPVINDDEEDYDEEADTEDEEDDDENPPETFKNPYSSMRRSPSPERYGFDTSSSSARSGGKRSTTKRKRSTKKRKRSTKKRKSVKKRNKRTTRRRH